MPALLTNKQEQQLKQLHKTLRDKRQADRIKAILYLNYGLTYDEISKLLMFDKSTLARHKRVYQKKGIEGLLEFSYTGGHSQLTPKQEEELQSQKSKS